MLIACTLCAAWGTVATVLFFHGWLAFLGVIAAVIGPLRGYNRNRDGLLILAGFVCKTFSLMGLLSLGFILLCARGGYGYTGSEAMLFLVTATGAMIVLLPTISSRLDAILRLTHGGQDP